MTSPSFDKMSMSRTGSRYGISVGSRTMSLSRVKAVLAFTKGKATVMEFRPPCSPLVMPRQFLFRVYTSILQKLGLGFGVFDNDFLNYLSAEEGS
jgi:hypothetical protein